MSNQTRQINHTVVRSTLVVPTHGFGMGDVCPPTAGFAAATPMVKRHLDAFRAITGSAYAPWSPPVT